MTLLHQLILQKGSNAHPQMLDFIGEPLANARVVDVSEPLKYFWDETPDEQTFSERVLPTVEPPPLRHGPLFLEGAAPEALKVTFTQSIGGRTVLPEPVLERLGFLLERVPVGDPRWPADVPPDSAAVVKLAPLFLQSGTVARPVGPQLVWGVPLLPNGRTHPSTVRTDVGVNALSISPPGIADPEAYSEALIRENDDHMLAAMFCSFCVAMASRGFGALVPHRSRRTPEGAARWEVLDAAPLIDLLDRKGKAREMGLAHAITVCGDELTGRGQHGQWE